jgi:hypothetical protein
MELREIENYPDAVIAPYQDPLTKAIYPEAVYTNGMFSVSSRDKTLIYEIDVYASVEAFESGGTKIATPVRRVVTTPATEFYPENGAPVVSISYDDVIMGNAQVVGAVLSILSGIETQFNPADPE